MLIKKVPNQVVTSYLLFGVERFAPSLLASAIGLIGPSSAYEELEFESLSSAILKNVPCDTADLVEKHINT